MNNENHHHKMGKSNQLEKEEEEEEGETERTEVSETACLVQGLPQGQMKEHEALQSRYCCGKSQAESEQAKHPFLLHPNLLMLSSSMYA